ncbi:MAG TPA: RNA polymerase subunit sigma-70 [Polyangiaceae bacterium]|jgi:RNA polymerase sigma-70 factor (ECF subfamily)
MERAEFERLVGPERRSLLAHCYRMLGSNADAEDALQETLVRAWTGIEKWEQRSSLRTWLHRIATNASIDVASRRGPRVMPNQLGGASPAGQPPGPPKMETLWLEPAPVELLDENAASPEATVTSRESLGIAFLAAIQRLPPQQRAVLLLRDVLGWSAAEVADLLETTVAAVNSALQRARATMERPATPAPPSDDAIRTLLSRYAAAWESGAPELFANVLRDDAILTMPPMEAWMQGLESIAALVGWIHQTMGAIRMVPMQTASGPSLAGYLRAPGDTLYRASGIHVLVASGDRVAESHAFLVPHLFERFGLPLTINK